MNLTSYFIYTSSVIANIYIYIYIILVVPIYLQCIVCLSKRMNYTYIYILVLVNMMFPLSFSSKTPPFGAAFFIHFDVLYL